MDLEKMEKRAAEIEKNLAPYVGMTFSEAKKHGFTQEDEKLQTELWVLGYKISRAKKELKIAV